MQVKTDYQSIVEEVKERNRLFTTVKQIRKTALKSCTESTPEEFRSQFEAIVQKCDAILRQSM